VSVTILEASDISAYPSKGYTVPLYVKDPEVDRLAARLATLRRTSKTEVVRQALLHELERVEGAPSLVEQGLAFIRSLHAESPPVKERIVDRTFIDALYGEP